MNPVQSLSRPQCSCHRRTALGLLVFALNAKSRADSHVRFDVASASSFDIACPTALEIGIHSSCQVPTAYSVKAKLRSRASDVTELGQSSARRGVSNALAGLKANASTELDLPDATQLLLCRSWQSAEDRGPEEPRAAYRIQPLVVVKDVREHALEF